MQSSKEQPMADSPSKQTPYEGKKIRQCNVTDKRQSRWGKKSYSINSLYVFEKASGVKS